MAAAKTSPEPDRTVQRLIGEGKAKLDDSRRKLDEIDERPRQKMPSFEDLRKIEAKQAELEGRVEDVQEDVEEVSKVHDQAALSFAWSQDGKHFSARGWVAGLVVVVLATLAGAWIHAKVIPTTKAPATESPK